MSPSRTSGVARGFAVIALVIAVAGARAVDTTDPSGRFRLTTVDGSRVPMLWDQAELPAGGVLRLSWVDGTAQVARDGSLTLVLWSRISGPGAPGLPVADTARGEWYRDAQGRVEVRFADGRRFRWPDTTATEA
jgi:hypothetical protein